MSGKIELLKKEIIKHGILLAEKGLVTGTGGNISMRIPQEDLMIITPSGIAYEKLQTDDLVILDMEGNVVDGKRRPSIEVNMHLEILRSRQDIGGIVHTHSVYASAIAITRQDLPVILDAMGIVFGGPVQTAEYAGIGTKELAKNVVKALGNKPAVLLANHGAVCVGENLTSAFDICELLEASAKSYIYGSMVGKPVVLSEELIMKEKEDLSKRYGQEPKTKYGIRES